MPSEARSFLTARWVHLVMANYEVEPSVLRPLVPKGTTLDFWSGRCFVSVVGFQFLDTRVLGVAVPFHRNFDEVNLRFYVQRTTSHELRRGVVFVKEVVPRRAIAAIANTLYNEKYVALPMSHDDRLEAPERTIRYGWQHGATTCHLACTLDGPKYLPDDNTAESFISEHYWGYTAQRDGSTLEYRVEHPRWHVWQTKDAELVCDVAPQYGAEFAPFLVQQPASCFVADGSAVTVRRGVSL
ncbi:MAG TPA: DUF2071 domain-containing protein [Polyangiaceae bacterium]